MPPHLTGPAAGGRGGRAGVPGQGSSRQRKLECRAGRKAGQGAAPSQGRSAVVACKWRRAARIAGGKPRFAALQRMGGGREAGSRGGGAFGGRRRPPAHGPSHPARLQAAGSEVKGEREGGGEGGRWGGRGIHGGGGGGRGGPSSRGASPVDGCQPRARSPGATTQHSNRAG